MAETMINCFEARQEFPAFWRRELAAERRAALVSHLARCAKCDRAFRNFALGAPVLHSASEPPQRSAAEGQGAGARDVRAARSAGAVRGEFVPRRGLAMSAAALVLIAASLAAYFSVTTPDTLNDELSADPIATQILGPDLYPSSEDLAG
jgi:anti-sigma factor RsiW